MSKNRAMDPRHGTMGQNQSCNMGKGGANSSAKPFGQTTGTNNSPKHASPQFGVSGQRLSGGKGGKATGYPPGYTSK